MLHEVSVRVKTLRHLPQQFFQDEKERELALSKRSKVVERQQQHQHGRGGVDHRRCLRAQASISNETRETGNSVWGRGMRSREAMWLRGVDTLSWSLPEQQFKLVKAYTPVCKVHVYAADASSPTMDTCDAVGWFIVDMRDLAGQRQQERWVKLQGASPAEVLISSSLAMARDRADLPKQLVRDPVDPTPRSPLAEPVNDTAEEEKEGEFPVPAAATPTPTADATPNATATATASSSVVATAATVTATAPLGAEAAQGPTFEAEEAEIYPEDEGIAVLATSAAEAVSDLEALPVGPGADGDEARTFSLSISVKGAAGLAGLAPSVEVAEGVGFWFSYSIFGVVVQTDRFDRLAAPPPGGGPLLEPMLDSFRLRATLQGLCEFLGEAPPLQVYLCTEGCILAHADIDMSCLLPRGEWGTRTTSQFCRTGIEGDFNLHLPGELLAQPDEQREALQRRRRDAVVTIGAELTRIGSTPGDCIQGEAAGGIIGGVKPGAGLDSWSGERGSPGMRTWAYLAGKRQRGGVITASLQRLQISPVTRGVADRLQRVLVGIHGAEESLPQGDTKAAATMAAAEAAGASVVEGGGGPVSLRGFGVVGCGETGGVETESTSLLGDIVWKWEGNFPPGGTGGQQLQGGGRPLAVVRVLGGGAEHVEVAAGVVPWPSPARSGRQLVDVKLMSPDGSEIGSCRVCLGVEVRKGGDVDGAGVEVHDESVESGAESVLKEGGGSKRVRPEGTRQGLEGMPPRVRAGATVSSKGVQAEELALEGGRKAPGGEVPRSYRLSVNLASVKDLENAAYVVARYHYPYFGTSAPVRTSLVWVAPRMDTPLSNSCCTFSFGMSLDRLEATVQDRKLVVSLRNKDRFKEEEVGLVTLPLEDVVKADPQYFRCRDTNKTFTSMTGFRAHLKSRQRAGELSLEDASTATPVEVKVLDTYLTVADARKLSGSSSPPLNSSGVPARLCSLRVILLLEDMGTTGDPHDKVIEAWLGEEAQHSPNVRTEDVEGGLRLASPSQGLRSAIVIVSIPKEMLGEPRGLEAAPHTLLVDGRQVAGSTRRAAEGPTVKLQGGVGGEAAGVDVERVRREWEQWRLREETAFAKRLREKDQALEDKWEARESARRRDLMHAQTDYSKLEGKLRKALSEVEARERQLKAKEESWRSEHAQKVSELQLLQRRLREETKHQVELERMKVKALEKQLSSHAKALEAARARVTATDEDLERFRQQQRRTPEGGLRQEIFRLGAAKAEAEAQVERERSLKSKALLEKEEYRAHIHKLVRTLRRHQERESTCARRDMEQLRLEYLAREERFMLDGDRNELRTIKQELDELRHVSLVQEAQANLAKVNTGPTNNSNQTPAPTSAPAPTVAGSSGLPSSFHGAPGMAEFADPGPSPCPPPRPTPAPAPALVALRREAGSLSRGSGGGATGRGGYGGSSLAASGGGSGIVGGGVGVGGSGASDEEEEEVERLVGWRDDLLATGMYTEQNPIVSEMSRRIAEASRRRAEGWQRQE